MQIIDRLENITYPPMLVFDVTNVCNLRCIHCPHTELIKSKKFVKKHLDKGLFYKAIDEVGKWGGDCLIRLTGDGEPLLHPDCLDMIAYAKANSNAVINLTTNGILMDREKAFRLIEDGIDLIDISVDALFEPTYNKVRRGGNYKKLLENIFGLLNIIGKKGAATKVMVSFIRQDQNQKECESFQNFWKTLVDYVIIRNLHSASGMVKIEESKTRNKSDKIKRYPCPHLWKRLTIDFMGDIKFCAHDWSFNRENVIENIEFSTIADAWHSERLKELRTMHKDNVFDNKTLCSGCSDWASTSWEYGYERLIDKIVYRRPVLMKELDIKFNYDEP